VDFHHQVNAHAGRTKNQAPQGFAGLFILPDKIRKRFWDHFGIKYLRL
jgi:hypothetical protein